MAEATETTTTKHPHLSVVQVFKDPCRSAQKRDYDQHPTTCRTTRETFFNTTKKENPKKTASKTNRNPRNTRQNHPGTARKIGIIDTETESTSTK
ncbi:hypothetical protein [Thauera sp.]|uniref:hypothetical protein n=1 Tax=Thauera sp. TaxID=1905334 RepID=UPI0039E257F4